MATSPILQNVCLLTVMMCVACETNAPKEERASTSPPTDSAIVGHLNALTRDFGHTPIGTTPLTVTWSPDSRALSYKYVNYRAIMPVEEIDATVQDMRDSVEQFAWWVILTCRQDSKCIRYDFEMANVGDRFVSKTSDFRFSTEASAKEFAEKFERLGQ